MIKAVNNFVELNRQLQVIKYFLSSTSNSVFLFFSGGQFISFLKLTKELKIILCNPKSNQLEETIIIFDYFKKQFNIRITQTRYKFSINRDFYTFWKSQSTGIWQTELMLYFERNFNVNILLRSWRKIGHLRLSKYKDLYHVNRYVRIADE